MTALPIAALRDPPEDWPAFRDRWLGPDLVTAIASRSGIGAAEVARKLAAYANEAGLGIALAQQALTPGMRVLEVGAGLGLVSLYLRHAGYDMTALEPVGQGFDFFAAAGDEIRRRSGAAAAPLLAIGAEALDPTRHGTFDLIFSVNVVEHVPDFAAAMRAMSRVLAPAGRMIHLCPNYWIPYEPHFGLPLLPLAPRLTARFLPARVGRSPVWRSLNFVTYGAMRRAARENGLEVTFAPALLAEALDRLGRDREFARRHGGVVAQAAWLARRTGLTRLLARLPAALATPMLADLRRARAGRA